MHVLKNWINEEQDRINKSRGIKIILKGGSTLKLKPLISLWWNNEIIIYDSYAKDTEENKGCGKRGVILLDEIQSIEYIECASAWE